MRIVQELGLLDDIDHNDNNNNTNTNNNSSNSNSSSTSTSTSSIVPYHKGVYWLNGTGYLGDPLHGSFSINQTAVEPLQWMLTYTMGSPKAFIYPKKELIEEQKEYYHH